LKALVKLLVQWTSGLTRAFFVGVAEWSIAPDCKSGGCKAYEGSNPSPSTMTKENTENGVLNSGGMLENPEALRQKPEETARILMEILSANYGTHNLTKAIEPLISDIKSGKIHPFIENEGMIPVACAALIKLNETDVELGRGACVPHKNGGKGLPLIAAFNAWIESRIFPESKVLRAEVRTAKPTKEVPGGQATQVICFNKLGLKPTAIGPFFHHGIPDRQEMFFLANRFREPITSSLPAIPLSIFSDSTEFLVFTFLWEKFFGQTPEFRKSTMQAHTIPDPVSGNENDTRFTTFRASLKTEDILKPPDFSLIGFEPAIVNGDIDIQVLFGKLSQEGKQNLILPSFVEGIFPQEIEDALMKTSMKWRQ
jgi:hypothetical protein